MFQQRARVLIVGSGRMGQLRASILYANPRFELCGIVDKNEESAKYLASSYLTRSFPSIREAVSQNGSSVQGLIICSPTQSHESIINEAIAENLDIFTEKPVAENATKITDLFESCNRSNVNLCCGFQRRFDESYVTVKKALQNGHIGNPIHANIFFGDHPCPPLEFLLNGGDIFYDLSAHDIDYIRWCLGNDDIVSVYATGSSSNKELEKANVLDNASIVLKFKRGTVVNIFMSRSATYGYDQRCEIFGDKGLLTVSNEHQNTAALQNYSGIHFSKFKHSFPQRFHQAFSTEMEAFADLLLLGNPWPITAHDCISVQKVSDGARLSYQTNAVVSLESLVTDADENISMMAY